MFYIQAERGLALFIPDLLRPGEVAATGCMLHEVVVLGEPAAEDEELVVLLMDDRVASRLARPDDGTQHGTQNNTFRDNNYNITYTHTHT